MTKIETDEYIIENGKISFIRDFNKLLDDYLHLIKDCNEVLFVCSFNQSIDILPNNIKSITIENKKYDKPINKLPINLEKFSFHAEFYDFPNGKMLEFPRTLKHLLWFCYGCEELEVALDDLPNYIESLELGIEFDSNELKHFINLKSLHINIADFDDNLDNLPDTLLELCIQSSEFNKPLDNLPPNLKEFELYNDMESIYDYSFDYLPITLEKLVLPNNYKGNLDNLPNNLKSLTIGYEFSSSLNNLPDSIEYIEWISIYEYKGKIMKLPKNLKEVVYGHNYETKNMTSKIRRMLLRNTKIKITDMFGVEK